MAISDGIHQSHEPAKPPLDPGARRGLYWYTLPLVIGPLLLLAIAFVLIPSDYFTRLGGDEWLIGMGYGATLHHVDCKVVVYGDSTAEVGVDPAEIERQTGLSTCNLGENAGLVALNGTAVLDRYLEQNAPPKYLIFLFGAEDFNIQGPNAIKEHGVFEGITYRLRQPDKLAGLAMIMRHPANLFRWISTGLDTYLRNVHSAYHLSDEQFHQREHHGGQFTVHDATLSACTEPTTRREPNKAWVDSLRANYSKAGTTVLVDTMPLPACDPDLSFYEPKLQGLVDNAGVLFPVDVFVTGGRHVNAKGSLLLASMLSAQLNHLQQSNSTGAR